MTDTESTMDEALDESVNREESLQRLKNFILFLFKRLVVFVSFGPGVLGLLWLIGRIFPRR